MHTSLKALIGKASSLRLSTKIVLVVAGAVIVTFFVIGFSMRALYWESSAREWRNNAMSLVSFASSTVINNPDPEIIDRLADELDVDISYTGPNGEYSTRPGMPTKRQAREARRWGPRDMPPGFSVFRHKGRPYLAHNVGPRQIVYGRSEDHDDDWLELLFIPMIAILVLLGVFGTVIFYIRHKLAPLSAMSEQMEAFGAEAITGKASEKGQQDGRDEKDEIARLTKSYENMRRRVEDLLGSKEELLRAVSHEFRSPLARMRLALEFIEDEKLKTKINKDIEILDGLAGELLERATLDSGSMKPEIEEIDLCNVTATAVALFDDPKGAISVKKPDGPVMVLANRALLERCISNLIDNSLRYSRVAKDSIKVAVLREEKYGVVEISDSGRQLESEVVDKLLEPFYRPDDSRARHKGGVGLGLAIVDSIVKAIDGKIEVVSPEDGGLTVRIYCRLQQ